MHRLSRLIFLLTALAASGSAMIPASAQAGDVPIKIRVESILAANRVTDRAQPVRIDMDKRLKKLNLANRLTMMFGYSSYRLLQHQEDSAQIGGAVAFNLPGGHILHVCLLEFRGNVLIGTAEMFEGERLTIGVPMQMTDDGVLMLVDEHQPNQSYITAISADVAPFDGPSKVLIDPRRAQQFPAFPQLVPAFPVIMPPE